MDKAKRSQSDSLDGGRRTGTWGHREVTPFPTLSIGRGLHSFHKLLEAGEHVLRVLVVGLNDLHHGGAGDVTGHASARLVSGDNGICTANPKNSICIFPDAVDWNSI